MKESFENGFGKWASNANVFLNPQTKLQIGKKYDYNAAFKTGSSEETWVAKGITIRWETYPIYHIDNIGMEKI